jgi:hypothetical protein
MPSTDRSERLFTNIVRLRDAQRRVPDDEGLAHVLADLERELGPTVTRNFAAKMLGVSHTGLQRWVDAGDLSLVSDPRGRARVPVGVLLRLHDELRRRRRGGGEPGLHVLEPLMLDSRRRAERVSVPHELTDGNDSEGGHGRATRRARAYHAVLARRLRRADVQEARRQLRRWQLEGRIDPRYADAWQKLLDRPIVEIKRALVENTSQADDLRQNSPLAGLLSEAERRKVIEQVP